MTRQVGPYRIERELARGGMGVVSVAQHVELDRRVALKELLSGGNAKAGERERFQREAQALAKLSHPYIVRVYEVGLSDRGYYMAMDLIEGDTLAQRLSKGPLAPSEAARLIEQTARAIHAAHGAGILHRDIKPANILLAPDETPRITDFGIARDAAADAERLTQTGELLGTPAYMPPEQASGEKDLIDERVDVYALGATLFALLTGEPPFTGATTVNIVTQVLHKPAPRISSLRPEVPADLETIITKCLEKERAHRYRSAAAFADDLARHLAGEPIRATPPSLVRRFSAWRRRHRGLTLTLTLCALAALTSGVVLALSLRHPQQVLSVELESPTAVQAWPLVLEGRVTGGRYDRLLVLSEGAQLADRKLMDGRFRVRVSPRDPRVARFELQLVGLQADGSRSEVHSITADRDDEPPTLVFDPAPAEVYPEAVLSGTLSEAATVRIAGEDHELPAGAFRLVLDTRSSELRELNARATDRAGNLANVALPLVVLSADRRADEIIDALPAGTVALLQPGEHTASYTLTKPVRLVGVPGETHLVPSYASRSGSNWELRGSLIRVSIPPGTGSTAPVTTFAVLRGLSLSSHGNAGPKPLVHVQGGHLRVEGCEIAARGKGPGLFVGLDESSPGPPELSVEDCTFVRYDIPSIFVSKGGRAWVRAARIGAATERAEEKEEEKLLGLTQRLGSRDSEHRKGAVQLARDGWARLEGCTIRKTWGQGIHLSDESRVELYGCKILENMEEGLMLDQSSQALLRDTVFERNNSEALFVDDDAWADAEDCRFLRNGLEDSDVGCGLLLEASPSAPPTRLRRCLIEGNGNLAGIELRFGRLELESTRIVNNQGLYGIWVKEGAQVLLTDSAVAGNAGHGIGFEEGGGRCILRNSRVEGNSAGSVVHKARGVIDADEASVVEQKR